MSDTPPALNRTLSGIHLWGIAVGPVISGEYFGWSYGWGVARGLVTRWRTRSGSGSGAEPDALLHRPNPGP